MTPLIVYRCRLLEGRRDRATECNFATVKSDLAELLALIAFNNKANDMTRVVDVCVRNRREVQVATLYIGAMHQIKPLPELRGL
jgi:hypothetical protein